MFKSFFPQPRLFFISVVLWAGVMIAGWYLGGEQLGGLIGLPPLGPNEQPPIGVSIFWSAPFLWFYLYYTVGVLVFAAFWFLFRPHRWQWWSVLGSALVIFTTYFSVQVSVAVNAWYGPYYDMVQQALTGKGNVTAADLYQGLLGFAGIAFVAVTVSVFNYFFVSHYVFRWRTAMNEFYMSHWPRLRHIEGASQRIQEDTMRFSSTMESLGVGLIRAIMTLIAFLPVLFTFSETINVLPFFGEVPHALLWAALAWSFVGTGLLGLIGIKLPGLEFLNQKVEAAYRKELVYGEDDPSRAQPEDVKALFKNVRHAYFRIYFHYLYFNIARIFYLQADNVFGMLVLIPSIAAGKVTLGLMNQVLNVFEQVRSSFQYLITSWTTIVELMSIYKRLRGFEAALDRQPGSDRDDYLHELG